MSFIQLKGKSSQNNSVEFPFKSLVTEQIKPKSYISTLFALRLTLLYWHCYSLTFIFVVCFIALHKRNSGRFFYLGTVCREQRKDKQQHQYPWSFSFILVGQPGISVKPFKASPAGHLRTGNRPKKKGGGVGDCKSVWNLSDFREHGSFLPHVLMIRPRSRAAYRLSPPLSLATSILSCDCLLKAAYISGCDRVFYSFWLVHVFVTEQPEHFTCLIIVDVC